MTRRTAQNRPGGRRPTPQVRSFVSAAATRYAAAHTPSGVPAIGRFVVKAALLDRFGPAIGVLKSWVALAAEAGADPGLARRIRSGLQGGRLDGLAAELEAKVPLASAAREAGWELLRS